MLKGRKRITRPVVMLLVAFVASCATATDYTWLTSPVSSLWLNDANWDAGVWVPNAANTATFGGSSQKLVDVNGSVALVGLMVNEDGYIFTNGTLTVEGNASVAAGQTATAFSTLRQNNSSTRFVKTGDGDLVLKGDCSTTNQFYRLGVRGGTMTLDGATVEVTGAASGAGEAEVAGSFANNSRFVMTGGSQLSFTAGSTYIANSGCDMVIENGFFDCWRFNEFLNGFTDNNGVDNSDIARLTVRDQGVFRAKMFRISKLWKDPAQYPNYGVVNVETGGVLQVRSFNLEKTCYGRMNFNGGTLEFIDTDSGEPTDTTGVSRFGVETATQQWELASLNILDGGATIKNTHNSSWIYRGFKHGSGDVRDGGVRISGHNTLYFYGNNTYNGGTYLDGMVWFCVRADGNLGMVPNLPENNIFINSSDSYFHMAQNCDLHFNRSVWIGSNVTMRVGTAAGKIGRIRGTFGGPDDATFGKVQVGNDWTGVIAFDPGEGRTNKIGRLLVKGLLDIESGTTLITSNSAAAVDANCSFFISRDGSNRTTSFSDTEGILTLKGGRLVIPKNMFAELSSGAQVYVKGGVLDAAESIEWLNGLGTPGRTVVQDAGEMIAKVLRISHANYLDGNCEPLASVQVKTGGVLRLFRFSIDTKANAKGTLLLDGGTVVARANAIDFLGSSNEKWTNIFVRAGEGGARFDTDVYNITIQKDIVSGAAADGGFTKLGTGTLTLTNTNTWNGSTCVEGGTLAFSKSDGFPGGNLDFSGAGLMSKADDTPFVTIPELRFKAGGKIRIRGAQMLDSDTFVGKKPLVSVTTPLVRVPDLVLLNDAGEEIQTGNWYLNLSPDGKTLRFGALHGTLITIR